MAEKEYIGREALVEQLKKEECDCEWLWTILCIPAADVAPVKHGHWKKVKATKDRQKTDLFTMIDISVIAVGGAASVTQK